MNNTQKLSLLIPLAVLATVFDGLATLIGVKLGLLVEINPVMSFLIDYSVPIFFIVKILMVLGASGMALECKEEPFIIKVLAGAGFIYFMLAFWTLTGIYIRL